MALQTINIGQFVNDGTGDDIRTAFSKINANFDELDLQGGQANTISNIGTGKGIYKEKIGVDLRLKSLKSGTGINIKDDTANELTIENNAPNFVTITSNNGTITANSVAQSISIIGANGVTTSTSGNVLTITGSTTRLQDDLNPKLGNNLDLNGKNILGGTGTNITASQFLGNFQGNLTGTVYGIDVRDIDNRTSFDFGTITAQLTSPIQYFLAITDIDMGSILLPNPLGIDGGTIV